MDYNKLYFKLMDYCKETTPIERIIKRNKTDDRIGKDNLYTEKHHIIPKHDCGNDNTDNLVNLLPEEHYLAHLIRYRWKKHREDFLACRFMINGYKNKEILKGKIPTRVTSKMISSLKQHTYRFRKQIGWHSDEGIYNISKSRLGTFPVKDSKTGEILGSFNRNHPKILDGTWVHHSTGETTGIDKNGNRVKLPSGYFRENPECDLYISSYSGVQSGSKNGNYKGVDAADVLYLISLVKFAIIENHIDRNLLVDVMNSKYFIPNGFNKISLVWVGNHIGNLHDVAQKYNDIYGTSVKYNPKFRSTDSIKKLRASSKGYAWVCNEKEVKRIKLEDLDVYIKNGYKRGRK